MHTEYCWKSFSYYHNLSWHKWQWIWAKFLFISSNWFVGKLKCVEWSGEVLVSSLWKKHIWIKRRTDPHYLRLDFTAFKRTSVFLFSNFGMKINFSLHNSYWRILTTLFIATIIHEGCSFSKFQKTVNWGGRAVTSAPLAQLSLDYTEWIINVNLALTAFRDWLWFYQTHLLSTPCLLFRCFNNIHFSSSLPSLHFCSITSPVLPSLSDKQTYQKHFKLDTPVHQTAVPSMSDISFKAAYRE